MDSFFISRRAQVLPQRGRGPRPPSEVAARGPRWRWWPPPTVPRTGCYAGESPRGSVIRALWGPGWTRFSLSRRAQVLPQRGHGPSPTITTGLAAERCRAEGSAIGILAPFRGPLEAVLLQGKRLGVHDSRPLGSGMDTSAYIADARSTARTGASPSPPSTAARRQGSKNARWPPRATPQKAAVSRENPAGVRDSRPLGSGMGSSASSLSLKARQGGLQRPGLPPQQPPETRACEGAP
jgi:hypothetical protein